MALDSRQHFINLQLAPVDGTAIVECSPYQRFADACLAARHVRARPFAAFDQIKVDVARMPVRVEVCARRLRGQ